MRHLLFEHTRVENLSDVNPATVGLEITNLHRISNSFFKTSGKVAALVFCKTGILTANIHKFFALHHYSISFAIVFDTLYLMPPFLIDVRFAVKLSVHSS